MGCGRRLGGSNFFDRPDPSPAILTPEHAEALVPDKQTAVPDHQFAARSPSHTRRHSKETAAMAAPQSKVIVTGAITRQMLQLKGHHDVAF
jgi:hypothetical protein